jgi:hypothetical protein
MPAVAVRHQNRHYKTLIALVLAMTGGTFLLYGISKWSPVVPVTPLRAEAQPTRSWSAINVRTQVPGTSRGFFHWRIDESGQLARSDAWITGQDLNSDGTIHVLITSGSRDGGVTTSQARQLSLLVNELRKSYGIPKDRVVSGKR